MKTCRRCRLPMIKSGSTYMCSMCGSREKIETRNIEILRRLHGELTGTCGIGEDTVRRIIDKCSNLNRTNVVVEFARVCLLAKSYIPNGCLIGRQFDKMTLRDFLMSNNYNLNNKDILIIIR